MHWLKSATLHFLTFYEKVIKHDESKDNHVFLPSARPHLVLPDSLFQLLLAMSNYPSLFELL